MKKEQNNWKITTTLTKDRLQDIWDKVFGFGLFVGGCFGLITILVNVIKKNLFNIGIVLGGFLSMLAFLCLTILLFSVFIFLSDLFFFEGKINDYIDEED